MCTSFLFLESSSSCYVLPTRSSSLFSWTEERILWAVAEARGGPLNFIVCESCWTAEKSSFVSSSMILSRSSSLAFGKLLSSASFPPGIQGDGSVMSVSQFMSAKNGCSLSSEMPRTAPSRYLGSFTRSFYKKSLASAFI